MAGMGLLSKAAVISVSHSKRKKHHLVVPTNLPSHSDTLIQYMLPFDMEAGRYSKHTQKIVVWETLLLSCSLEQTQGGLLLLFCWLEQEETGWQDMKKKYNEN